MKWGFSVKNIFLCLVCLCVIILPVYGDQTAWDAAITASNPLHWYRFDEAAGTVCTDYGSSGSNASYDGVTLAQDGLFGVGKAVEFSGSGANSVVLNGTDMNAAWTVEYVVMKKDKGAQALHDSGSHSIRIEQWNASGRVGMTHYGNADYAFSTVGSVSQIIPLNEWTYLAFRRDDAGKTQVFINGILAGTLDSSISLPMGRIGSHNGSGDKFAGILDESVVYDRALSDQEILEHSLVSVSAFSKADFDLSGGVDVSDLLHLAQYWLSDCGDPNWCSRSDIDFSTHVDQADFAALGREWLKGVFIPSVTQIIPEPVNVVKGNGAFTLQFGTQILVQEGQAELAEIGDYLATVTLNPATGFGLTVDTTAATAPPANSILLTMAGSDPSMGDEGYELIVTADSVLIRAPQPAGIFYGVQSLRQMLPHQIESDAVVSGVGWSIPAVTIRDQPRFPWRGMHLDESRHFFGIEYVKKYIDYLAMYKMNTLHWHIDDDQGWRIEIPAYPLLTELGAWRSGCDSVSPYGGYYTQAQVHEIVEYARRRYIQVVPEIEMPGHTQAVLEAYPQYSCTGGPFADVCANWAGVQYDNVFCPSEATFAFLESLLTEVMALFPSEYIHIGGDEVNKQAWQESAVAQQVMADNGLANENELQTWFISRINNFLVANGKKPIGWSEIIHGGIPDNAVVMSWLGMGAGITAAQNGHDAIMSPTSHCYFDYSYGGISTEKVYSFEPIPYELTEAQAQHVLGAQGNVWTERIPTGAAVDEKALPRMTALAEVVWTPVERKDWDDFSDRLSQHYLCLDELEVNYYYEWKVPGGPELKELAQVTSSFWAYSDYVHEYAYDGSLRSYFWTDRAPNTGDTVTVTLDTPRLASRVDVYAGTDSKPNDRLQNGVIEISSDGTNFTEIGPMTEMETSVSFTEQLVKAVRLRCTANQASWMILREIVLE